MGVENLELLKGEVERVFGRRILNSSDCQYLSNDIYRQTKVSVSLNTLRRYFGLMKSKYQPSSYTLTLLSKYCGFTSYDDFISHKERNAGKHPNQDTDLLNFLILLFRDLDVKGVEDITYKNLIHQIISNLEKWPQVIDEFQNQISKTSNGQLFYYEQFINIDKLNSYYGEGLRYYLHERKDPQAQIFGHSLLCFASWLSSRKEEVGIHCREISQYTLNQTIHPSACGRFFASQLYEAEMYGLDPQPILSAAREFYIDSKFSRTPGKDFPYFEFVLSEALILTRHYDEALYYIEESMKKKNNYMAPYVDVTLFESLHLFHAIALKNTGKTKKAKEIMERISIKNFYFLAKKFNLILFLLQKHAFRANDFSKSQLEYLIKQTGFKKLLSGFPEIIQMQEQNNN